MTGTPPNVYAGIDTHQATNHVGIVNELGKKLGDKEFPTTSTGYKDLLKFIVAFGTLLAVGIEGTASYGAGITAYLRTQKVTVREVIRPNRQTRRGGKSDPIDAYAAAKTIAADADDLPIPKLLGGAIDGLRVTQRARRTAVKARSAAMTQIQNFLTTAPDTVRQKYAPFKGDALYTALAATRPNDGDDLGLVLRRLARRITYLSEEIDEAEARLAVQATDIAPALMAATGVKAVTAAELLVTVGENPERITSKEAFAALCGTSPIPASSGKTHRHRLNRGGVRQANAALHRIVITRMAHDQRTKDYVARRTTNNTKSKKEVIRCLKRYVANEVYTRIVNPPEVLAVDDLRPLRLSMKITLQDVAGQFGVWPAKISQIERAVTRDDEFVVNYREFLLRTI
ncbi:IS110 family RNA-guided transposase [Brevibacterium aurantiacum]|uniref:IS110 family transposase n=1 Tax=Brevibacterium aurantiacum TaxID=273384 RepID=UPI001868DA0B|nr:IS110 family transposase [Brevibacterium aurantiacum]MDN6170511.1 IS110 family transposase [Micrococcaceae bacterium]MDN6193219.1 IS110 family transposase [Brevibacterium sp.]